MKKCTGLRCTLGVAVVMLVTAASADIIDRLDETLPRDTEWNFKVYLDDTQIGHHHFQLAERDDSWLLKSEADFRVKFLFFTAYRYQHVNTEVWSDSCLQRIESNTNANGTEFAVNGFQTGSGFTVETKQFRDDLGDCVKTFAYWDPAILDESYLLNSQTGELLPVEVEGATEETLSIKGEQIPAMRYHLVAKDMELDIWYSTDLRWLALESTVKGGRKLRYELT